MRDDDRRLLVLLGQGHRAQARPLPRAGVRRWQWLGGFAALLALLAFAWVLWRGEAAAPTPATTPAGPRADIRWWGNPALGVASDPVGDAPVPITRPVAPAVTEAEPDGLFRLDERGQLQLDERTRLDVERLLAMHDPAQLEGVLDGHLAGLPAQAVAAARQLVQQYAGYADAQKRSYPSGTAPLVPEEGLAELAGLSALRASYFGQEAAQRLFGEEEAIARRLLELMRDDPVPHAPMEEKAMRAQARFDQERAGGVGDSGRN
jgi:hypothetical protein